MGLVKYDDWVFEIDIEIFSVTLFNQINVGHKHNICALSSLFHCVIWAKALLLGLSMQIFDIDWIPGYKLLGVVFVIPKFALFTFDLCSTCCVQCQALVLIDFWIYAKIISWREQDGPGVVHGVSQLFLNLSQLCVCPWSINNPRQYRVSILFSNNLSLLLQPCQSCTEQAQSFTSPCRTLQQGVFAILQRRNQALHIIILAIVRLEWKIHIYASNHLFCLPLHKFSRFGLYLTLYLLMILCSWRALSSATFHRRFPHKSLLSILYNFVFNVFILIFNLNIKFLLLARCAFAFWRGCALHILKWIVRLHCFRWFVSL